MSKKEDSNTRQEQIYEARRQVASLLPQVGQDQQDLIYLYRSVEAYAHEMRAMMENDTTGREILKEARIGSITHEDIPAAVVEKYSKGANGSRKRGRYSDLPKLPNGREIVTTIHGVNEYLQIGPRVGFNVLRPPNSRQPGPQKEEISIAVPRRLSVAAYDKLNTAMYSLGLDAGAGSNREQGGNF